MLKAEEIEPFGAFGEVRDPGLGGMQPQPESVEDRRHQLAGLFGLLAGGAQGDEVICVLHQHPQPLPARLPRLIEHVQSDVCEQR